MCWIEDSTASSNKAELTSIAGRVPRPPDRVNGEAAPKRRILNSN